MVTAGEIVSQRELIDRVWPNINVEDSNPRFHVGALGDGHSADWGLRGPWSDSRQDDRHRLTRPRRTRATAFVRNATASCAFAPTRRSRPHSMPNKGGFDRSPAGGE